MEKMMLKNALLACFCLILISVGGYLLTSVQEKEATPNASKLKASKTLNPGRVVSDAHNSSAAIYSPPASSVDRTENGLTATISGLLKNGAPESLFKAHMIIWECKLAEQQKAQSFPIPETGLKNFEKRLAACAQLPAEYRRDYMGWLQSALKSRTPGAAAQYLIAGPNGEILDLQLRPDDPLVIEWQKNSFDYLLRDAKQGDISALDTLISSYGNGVLSKTVDVPTNVGLELALVQMKDSKAIKVSARERSYVNGKLNSLTVEDRNKAFQVAEEIISTGRK